VAPNRDMKKLTLLIFIVLTFTGCEKDDICIDGTTPRLILEFYDISNPGNLKPVLNLKVIAEGETEDLATFNGVTKIQLPLKISEDKTKYSLKINSSSATYANEDLLEFNYTRQNVYVSRACGYKTTYKLNDADGAFLSDAASPDGYWIQNMTVETKNITTENETHIKIYY
jgi:hypothetical protein